MKWFFRLAACAAITIAYIWFDVGASPTWPCPAREAIERLWHARAETALAEPSLADSPAVEPADAVETGEVEALPVCIASRSWSAGSLGDTILYRFTREGRTLKVGYFVYWTTERPWGKNALSYSLLPALFIDAFYSHLFFLLPGAQRFIHGPGDVEGARVTYERQDDGKWVPKSAIADDGLHREIALARDEFVDAEGRVVLMTDVWSHQLGAAGARTQAARGADGFTCFEGKAMVPLTDDVARTFRLGSAADPRRALPAWRLDLPSGHTVVPPRPLQANIFGAIGRVATIGR